MNALPSSIESYLEEAGFSGTEIIILKRLLEDDALTLRELAAKTGKSTGVLDLALKKLLKKGIVTKESINESSKYTLHSLRAIQQWMDRDMREKRELLLRKHKNFETFIATLARDKERPEMQHFEGPTGIEQAYMELLDKTEKGQEMLHYFPVTHREEDDPLREFRVQYFRERRRRGIFSRMLAHDTALGRRFQSRDAFEYRKSMLLSSEEYPFIFEQIIAGNTVACFDHLTQKACLIDFPQLANAQRLLFDSLWRTAEHGRKLAAGEVAPPPVESSLIPLGTRTLSALREFFLSRRSMAIIGLSVVFAAGITYGLYISNMNLNLQRIRERAQSIASTGVLQLDPVDLDALRIEEDWKKPQWAKVVNQLKQIRLNNEDVFFVYVFRESLVDPTTLEFVSDSHSMNPYANTDDDPYNNVDIDRDGTISGPDVLQWPGQVYPDPPAETFEAFKEPIATEGIYEDAWGKYVSGYAPIRDATGNPVAVLAIDIQARKLNELSNATFTPFLYFLILFLAFLVIRLMAFNRSLFNELLRVFNIRSFSLLLLSSVILSGLVTYGLYRNALRINFQRMQEQVKSIAAAGAFQFDAHDLYELQVEEDWHKPEWAKVVNQLINIRQSNENIVFAYVLRKSKMNPGQLEFVSDSHSLNPYAKIDLNNDGKFNEADRLSPPGDPYKGPPGKAFEGFNGPAVDNQFNNDQWGTFVSGYAPIRDERGNANVILGIDMRAEKLQEFTRENFQFIWYFALFTFLFFFLAIFILNPVLSKRVLQLFMRPKVQVALLVCSVLALGVTYGLYLYTLKLMENEVGNRLMSIAATAAPRFKAEDLNVLRFARDMKRPEYQRVFRVLNEIRDSNRGIRFVDIFRPTSQKGIWEFVADADSNYYIPLYYKDYDQDAQITEADENVWPGFGYDMAYSQPKGDREGLLHPLYEKGVDQWGLFVVGSAPILGTAQNAIATLVIDVDFNKFNQDVSRKYKSYFFFLLIPLIGSLIGIVSTKFSRN